MTTSPLSAEAVAAAVTAVHDPLTADGARRTAGAVCDSALRLPPNDAFALSATLLSSLFQPVQSPQQQQQPRRVSTPDDAICHFALLLLESPVRSSWDTLEQGTKNGVQRAVLVLLSSALLCESRILRSKVVSIAVDVALRTWPQQWPELIPALEAAAQSHVPHMQEIALSVFAGISEAVRATDNSRIEGTRRAQIMQSLGALAGGILGLISSVVVAKAELAASGNDPAALSLCKAAVDAAVTFCSWADVKALRESGVVGILLALQRVKCLNQRAADALLELALRSTAEGTPTADFILSSEGIEQLLGALGESCHAALPTSSDQTEMSDQQSAAYAHFVRLLEVVASLTHSSLTAGSAAKSSGTSYKAPEGCRRVVGVMVYLFDHPSLDVTSLIVPTLNAYLDDFDPSDDTAKKLLLECCRKMENGPSAYYQQSSCDEDVAPVVAALSVVQGFIARTANKKPELAFEVAASHLIGTLSSVASQKSAVAAAATLFRVVSNFVSGPNACDKRHIDFVCAVLRSSSPCISEPSQWSNCLEALRSVAKLASKSAAPVVSEAFSQLLRLYCAIQSRPDMPSREDNLHFKRVILDLLKGMSHSSFPGAKPVPDLYSMAHECFVNRQESMPQSDKAVFFNVLSSLASFRADYMEIVVSLAIAARSALSQLNPTVAFPNLEAFSRVIIDAELASRTFFPVNALCSSIAKVKTADIPIDSQSPLWSCLAEALPDVLHVVKLIHRVWDSHERSLLPVDARTSLECLSKPNPGNAAASALVRMNVAAVAGHEILGKFLVRGSLLRLMPSLHAPLGDLLRTLPDAPDFLQRHFFRHVVVQMTHSTDPESKSLVLEFVRAFLAAAVAKLQVKLNDLCFNPVDKGNLDMDELASDSDASCDVMSIDHGKFAGELLSWASGQLPTGLLSGSPEIVTALLSFAIPRAAFIPINTVSKLFQVACEAFAGNPAVLISLLSCMLDAAAYGITTRPLQQVIVRAVSILLPSNDHAVRNAAISAGVDPTEFLQQFTDALKAKVSASAMEAIARKFLVSVPRHKTDDRRINVISSLPVSDAVAAIAASMAAADSRNRSAFDESLESGDLAKLFK